MNRKTLKTLIIILCVILAAELIFVGVGMAMVVGVMIANMIVIQMHSDSPLFLISFLHQFAHADAVIQLALADTQALGGAFQQLIVCQEFKTLFQRIVSGCDQSQRFV